MIVPYFPNANLHRDALLSEIQNDCKASLPLFLTKYFAGIKRAESWFDVQSWTLTYNEIIRLTDLKACKLTMKTMEQSGYWYASGGLATTEE